MEVAGVVAAAASKVSGAAGGPTKSTKLSSDQKAIVAVTFFFLTLVLIIVIPPIGAAAFFLLLIWVVYEVFNRSSRARRKLIREHMRQQSKPNTPSRTSVPSNVKLYVWRRDGGRCVQCGTNENLEYDHIIPVSKGGSNTERNVQLLCEHCNRTKHAKIR